MNPFGMNMFLLAQDETSTAVAEAVKPATDAVQTAASSGLPGWLTLLIVIVVMVLPFVVANLLASALRVKEMATRIGVSLFVLTLFSVPFLQQIVAGNKLTDAISLGIDLAGGTNMVLEVDSEEAKKLGKEVNTELMDRMVAAIGRRVNPTGTEEVTVRKVGGDRIEVIVPGADDEKRDRVKRMIFDLGQLEFHILANQFEHGDLIRSGEALPPDQDDVFQGDKKVAMWRPSAIVQETGELKVNEGDGVRSRKVQREGKEVTQFLVVIDPDPARHITGRLLKSVRETVSDSGLAVGFTFNDRGGYLMNMLTTRYQPRDGAGYMSRLAVLLNNEIHSAPVIKGVIAEQGMIDGRFSQEELDDLISVLNAGALEVPLKPQPVNEFTVSPLLGEDVQRKGMTALGLSLAAVLVVTAVYYLKAGFVADVCLLLNVVLVVGAMSIIDATFTLPGLAGLVLTIGMAVDANVLIFERMREETAKGSSLRLAIKNGFEKAFSTIFDSNVTTLITAVILYYIGTDQVKGFAVSLFIGICMSMFTALYVGRLIFDIAEKKRWLTDLKMMSLVNAEKIDFVGKTRLAVMASIAMIVVGVITLGVRGQNNLDIDFRGGSMISFQFRDGDTPPSIDEVRGKLSEAFQESVSLESLQIPEAGTTRQLYRLRTVDANALDVEKRVKEAFADTPYQLILQEVTLGEVAEIPAGDASAPSQFAGGRVASVTVKEPMSVAAISEEIQEALSAKYADVTRLAVAEPVNPTSADVKQNDFRIRFAAAVPAGDVQTALASMQSKLTGAPHFEEVNTFDSSVAGETQMAAINAILLSLLAIIGYLWLRFQKVSFGVAACVALVHDVIITVGVLALASYLGGNPVGALLGLTDFKINLPIVAAVLTVIGYSLNDTIVVFDRIREVRGRNPALTSQMVNQSLNQTLSRTLLTSMTTLVVLMVLYFLGGEGIHGFSFCLIVGILVGTYSSIYVAAPTLIWLTNRTAVKSQPITV